MRRDLPVVVLLRVLLEYGADANARNVQGDSPLHRAFAPWQKLKAFQVGAKRDELEELNLSRAPTSAEARVLAHGLARCRISHSPARRLGY